MRWKNLEPDPGMVSALDYADREVRHADALHGDQNTKKNWSNRFADGCAQIVADALRRNGRVQRFEIRPRADGTGREALTFVAPGRKKRVDVIAATLATGLQIGFSLKGLNFPNPKGRYTHNLTGRTYELLDEVGAIHEYQPSAFMVGLYMIPIQAVSDMTRAPSSFAKTVAHLRARTGRMDLSYSAHARRCDAAAVGLYVPGDPLDGFPRGVVRFFDVMENPPRHGRPRIETTTDLDGLVERISKQHAAEESEIEWAEPEDD